MTTSSPQPQHPASPAAAPDAFAAEPKRVPWAAVAVYAVLAVGLAWLVTLPMWLGDGLTDPMFGVYALGMMYTPAVAALVVTFFMVKPPYRARYLGLTPFKPVWRSIVLMLVWPIAFAALAVAGVWLASLFGWVDFQFSLAGFDEASELAGMPAETLLIIQLVMMPVIVAQATFSAFGEELGWRGFLVSALSPLGFWPMAIISGALWGVWHAPLILLGYNYGRTDIVGVLMMVGFCFFVGVLLNWARMWCRNMWVAAVGHGALNATATIGFLFIPGAATGDLDAFWQTALGLPGWILMAVVIAVMAALGLFGRRLPKPLVTVPAKVLRGSDAGPGHAAGATPDWAQPHGDAADVPGHPGERG